MSDLISRQAAINTLKMDHTIIPYAKAREYVKATLDEIRDRLDKLSSAVPERPKGEWEALTASEVCGWNPEFAGRDPIFLHRCSICKHDVYVNEFGEEILSDFCPFCGADMREKTDDIS